MRQSNSTAYQAETPINEVGTEPAQIIAFPSVTQPFTMVPNAVIEEYGPQVGPTALAVYLVIRKHRNNERGDAWPSAETIAAALGIKKRQTVYVALDRLEATGLIRRTPTFLRPKADRSWERVPYEWEPLPNGQPPKRLGRTSDRIEFFDPPPESGPGDVRYSDGGQSGKRTDSGPDIGPGGVRKTDRNQTNANQTKLNQTKQKGNNGADAPDPLVEEPETSDDADEARLTAYLAGREMIRSDFDAAALRKVRKALERIPAHLTADDVREAAAYFQDGWWGAEPGRMDAAKFVQKLPEWIASRRRFAVHSGDVEEVTRLMGDESDADTAWSLIETADAEAERALQRLFPKHRNPKANGEVIEAHGEAIGLDPARSVVAVGTAPLKGLSAIFPRPSFTDANGDFDPLNPNNY